MITAGVYGARPEYNAYVSISVIPNLIRQVFADAAVAAAFVPVFTQLLTKVNASGLSTWPPSC